MKIRIDESVSVSVSLAGKENGAEYYSVSRAGHEDRLHLEWTEPMTGHYGVWHPTCGRRRQMPQWFCAQKTESCLYKGAPVIATFTADGRNMICVSLSDTVSPVALGFYVDDFNGGNEVVFTLDIDMNQNDYSAVLRIDRSRIPLADAVRAAALWWNGSKEKNVPDEAYAPLYSSWYSFHQDPEQAKLTEELKKASELGFGTFILDDGWQIDGKGTKDYYLSGDWNVALSKFTDFGKFVSDVHSFGMKFMLWFAVPFAGFGTQAYARFRDKLLFEEKGYLNAGILDIRYPEVRKYIIDTYSRFITQYGIDGLKLDFIDNFRCCEGTQPFNKEMDCETVEAAVSTLLSEICCMAEKLKPGFLFEYRQYYVGPSVLKFGNMIRVADCAFDSLTNRIGIADLRMMTVGTAVHSDMLLWSPEESAENCKMQLLNVLFAAPQISVLLGNSTPEQICILKQYIRYASDNRDVLLKGRFSAAHPELNYTSLSSEICGKNRKITVLYADETYEYCGMTEDVWNGAFSDGISVVNRKMLKMRITVSGFSGETSETVISSESFIRVGVHPAEMIRIEKAE